MLSSLIQIVLNSFSDALETAQTVMAIVILTVISISVVKMVYAIFFEQGR